ncbi:MAG: precorrin-6y C5,15-methyltransferase (decarboxylating) subunit CbiE [Planctomycetota bacterium]
MNRITIVGMGDDGMQGLTGQAQDAVTSADHIVGTAGLLAKVEAARAKKIPAAKTLDDLRRQILDLPSGRNVLLAGGDPLFYGIARFLTESFGKDRFEVIPNVSSMQLAFARVKESWDDAYLTNLATTPLDRAIDAIRTAERAGLFTSESIPPAMVAEALLDRRIDYFTAYVCEDLGTPDETVTQGHLAQIRESTFAPMNVMILVRHDGAADRIDSSRSRGMFGNAEDMFLQSRPKRGLLTPMEVRCIALGQLALRQDSIVWDVGAGSGSLAIEAASICTRGRVYAIEMDAEDYGLMIENAKGFAVPNLEAVHGQAPEAWSELPPPDAIFVGGTGRVVPDLVRQALPRLKPYGRIVVNIGSPDNLVAVRGTIEAAGLSSDVRMVNIARGNRQMDSIRFEALPPTFLVSGRQSES